MSKRMNESQIVAILKEAEAGMLVKDICRKYNIGNSTFYKWREKYGGMEASDVRRLKELEEENRRLKQMYADLSLKSQLQEEIIKKAVVPVVERKVWAKELQSTYTISIALSCQITGMSRTAYYYKPQLSNDGEIIDALNQLVEKHQRWGFPKCYKRLRAKGYRWNHKRVYRIYTAMKLNLRRKNKKRLPPRQPEPLAVPNKLGQVWSMDFMSDTLHNKVRFRTFNVIDDYNREVLGIDIGTGMPASKVTRYLDRLAAWHGYPKKVRVDNGPEFTSFEFMQWAKRHKITIDYIKPGCPYQNAYIERFNRTYRHEVLDLYIFTNLQEVMDITENWITLYNTERPHDSLNDMTPVEYKL
ncbi:IS3 family transposase [Aliikangiella sp. IMCC44653]